MTFHALLAGLCPLIPLPVLDDWALSWVRRRLAVAGFRQHGLHLTGAQLDAVVGVGEKRSLASCLSWIVLWPVLRFALYLVAKVLRKIVILLTLKECVDTFTAVFHEGFLWSSCLDEGTVDRAVLEHGTEPLRAVRRAVKATVAEVDPRPVEHVARQTLSGSRRLLVRAAGRLARAMSWRRNAARKRAPNPEDLADAQPEIDEEERLLGGLLDRLSSGLWREEGYRERVLEAFRGALAHEIAPRPELPG